MGKPFQEGGCYGSSGRYFYFLLPRPTLPFPSAEVMVAFKQIVPIYLGAFFPLLLSPPVASPRFSSGPTNIHTWISGGKKGQKRQEEGRQDKSGGIELQIGKGGKQQDKARQIFHSSRNKTKPEGNGTHSNLARKLRERKIYNTTKRAFAQLWSPFLFFQSSFFFFPLSLYLMGPQKQRGRGRGGGRRWVSSRVPVKDRRRLLRGGQKRGEGLQSTKGEGRL